MSLLTKIQTLLSIWFPNKTQDKNNFDTWINESLQYDDNVLSILIWQPLLNGTDGITSWTTLSNTTSNGIFQSHGSFLTDGWSNDGLWKLDFDVQAPDGWKYVGLMPLCMEEINPFTDAKNTPYSITSWEGISYFTGLGFSSWDSADSMTKITDTNSHHITIEKLSDTKLKIIIDNNYTAIGNYSNLPNASVLHIGTRDNPASRNSGKIIQLSNIKVISKG